MTGGRGAWKWIAVGAAVIALFLAGVPLSNVIGAPISGWLLGLSGHGLTGWQWMLILEGIPSLVCGVATLWLLPDGPRSSHLVQQVRYRDPVTTKIVHIGPEKRLPRRRASARP